MFFFLNWKVLSPHNYLLCFGSKKSASHSYREITYKWKLSKEIMEISFIFYQTKHLTSNTSIHKCCRTDNFLRKKKNVLTIFHKNIYPRPFSFRRRTLIFFNRKWVKNLERNTTICVMIRKRFFVNTQLRELAWLY